MKNLDDMTLLFEAEFKDRSANSMDKVTLNRLAQIAKGNTDRINSKKPVRKESNEEFGTKTTAIKNCKYKVFKELVEFLNFCTGVGTNGDKSAERQVGTTKFDYTDKDGKKVNAFKGSYWPTKAEFDKVKNSLMKEVEQLNRYEEALNASKDQGISRKLKSIISRIHYDQLDFDTPEKDMHGKMRLNADIFDDLYPMLGSLRKSAIPNDLVKNIANKFGDEEDYGLQKLRNVMGRNIVKDQLSNRDENAKGRYQRMKKAIYDEKEYDKTRKMEQGIDNISNFAKQRNEIAAKAKEATSAEEKTALMKQSRKEYDASRYAAKNLINTKTPADFLTDNGVDKLTNKKATAILDKWIKENAPKDDAHKIKVYGSINGRSEQGLLAFIPGEKSTYGDKGIKLDGANAFRLVKTFFTKLTDEQKEYVEDNRKNAAWKARVNKILVKAGICTEGFDSYVDILSETFARKMILDNAVKNAKVKTLKLEESIVSLGKALSVFEDIAEEYGLESGRDYGEDMKSKSIYFKNLPLEDGEENELEDKLKAALPGLNVRHWQSGTSYFRNRDGKHINEISFEVSIPEIKEGLDFYVNGLINELSENSSKIITETSGRTIPYKGSAYYFSDEHIKNSLLSNAKRCGYTVEDVEMYGPDFCKKYEYKFAKDDYSTAEFSEFISDKFTRALKVKEPKVAKGKKDKIENIFKY